MEMLGKRRAVGPSVMRLQETCWQLILVKVQGEGNCVITNQISKINQWWGCAGGCGGASRMSPQSLPLTPHFTESHEISRTPLFSTLAKTSHDVTTDVPV